jgi:PAS domain S-box-containing protein
MTESAATQPEVRGAPDWQARLAALRTRATLPHSPKDLALYVAVAAACFASGELGLKLTILHPPVSPIWPPIGVALAALIVFGYRVWPSVYIASLLLCLSAYAGPRASFVISCSNTLEVVVACCLVNRFAGGVKAFETARGVLKFVLFACILSPIISATVCIGYLAPTGFMQGHGTGMMWLTWWIGDSMGALLFAPFLILVFGTSHHRLDGRELFELSILLIGLITVCLTVFGPLSYFVGEKQLLQAWLCIPFLIWTGFRFCQLEAAGTTLLLLGIAIWGTFQGFGPFVSNNFNVSLMCLAAFVAVMGTATLAIAATLSERRRMEEGLLGMQSLLQETVQEKTRDLTLAVESLQAEVSERTSAQNDLRESNDRFRQLAENVADVFWLMDMIEERILYVSPAYETIWGRSRRTLYADPHSWLDSVHPDDHHRAVAFFALGSNDKLFEAEYRILRPDGSVRHIWDRGYLIRDEAGRICRIAGLATDVTDKKLLAGQLQDVQKWGMVRD